MAITWEQYQARMAQAKAEREKIRTDGAIVHDYAVHVYGAVEPVYRTCSENSLQSLLGRYCLREMKTRRKIVNGTVHVYTKDLACVLTS